MRKLILLLLLTACAKTEDTCMTCDQVVTYQTMGSIQTYVESSVKYCSQEWVGLDGKTVKSSGTSQGGWWKKSVTTKCH